MSEKNYVLAMFRDRWADEMNVEGWEIMPVDYWEENLNAMNEAFKIRDRIEIYFGTNESNDYTKAELLGKITVKEITEEEYMTIFRLFGKTSHGHTEFTDFEYYLEDIKTDEGIDDDVDEDEFDEDEDEEF